MIKTYTYLGLLGGDKCCVLKSTLSPQDIREHADEMTEEFFEHDCTNWCGCDDIERTKKLMNLATTKVEYIKINPLKFYGTDYDHGHEYPWSVTVKGLQVCEEDKEAIAKKNALEELDRISSAIWFLNNEYVEKIKRIEDSVAELRKMMGYKEPMHDGIMEDIDPDDIDDLL